MFGHPERRGHQRLERRLHARQAGDRQRALGRAVVGDRAADHLVLVGLAGDLEVVLGQLPRGLDGLAATGGEEDPVEVARRVAGDPLRELDRVRVGVGPQRHERQLLGLLRGGLGQLRAAVAQLAHEQARQTVEVALAVHVVDVGALAADDDGHVGRVVGRVAREVHPQVVAGSLLEACVVVGDLAGHGYRFLACRACAPIMEVGWAVCKRIRRSRRRFVTESEGVRRMAATGRKYSMTRYGAQFGPDITFLGVPAVDVDDAAALAAADVVVVGAPFDGGTSHRPGHALRADRPSGRPTTCPRTARGPTSRSGSTRSRTSPWSTWATSRCHPARSSGRCTTSRTPCTPSRRRGPCRSCSAATTRSPCPTRPASRGTSASAGCR